MKEENEKAGDLLEYAPGKQNEMRERILACAVWIPAGVWALGAVAWIAASASPIGANVRGGVLILYFTGTGVSIAMVPTALRRKRIGPIERMLTIFTALSIFIASQLLPVAYMGG